MESRTRLHRQLKAVVTNIRAGRHVEAYVISPVGLSLAILGIVGTADQKVLLAALLVGISFLVFHSTKQNFEQGMPRQVVGGREDFGSFSTVLEGVRELWVYAPTAANVLAHSADIRRHVLAAGGEARFVVVDPQSSALAAVEAQLDGNIDFRRGLAVSVDALAKLKAGAPGRFQYRLLFNDPGFSLLIVNPRRHDGYVLLELHGFKDENIADRMHFVIRRDESPRWFEYWLARYEAIWNASAEPRST